MIIMSTTCLDALRKKKIVKGFGKRQSKFYLLTSCSSRLVIKNFINKIRKAIIGSIARQ